MSILDQGIDKLERTLKALPDPQRAPELVLHLHGLHRVKAAAATLRQAAADGGGFAPPFNPQMLPFAPAAACPTLFRGLVELSLGLAECKAASGSTTVPDGLDALLFNRATGMLRVLVETDAQDGMTMAALDASEVRHPLAAVAALAAYALVGDSDDFQRTRCSWESLNAVMAAVWPDSGSAARRRTLERNEWVPPPPVVAAAAGSAAAGSVAAGPAAAGPAAAGPAAAGPAATAGAAAAVEAPPAGSLAAALAVDLARFAPGVTLRDLRAATAILMLSLFSGKSQLAMEQMRELLVRTHDVPAGRAEGCFQLGSLLQATGRAGYMTASRWEPVMACFDGAAAAAAAAECAHAEFSLAESEASVYIQAHQVRERPDMRWLKGAAAARLDARGRAVLARAADCLQRLKPWLQPHKLAREKGRLRILEREMAAAMAATPARDALPQVPLAQPSEVCSQCKRPALHLRKCAACKSVSYCSRECQVLDWKEGGHKRACKALAQGGSADGGSADDSSARN